MYPNEHHLKNKEWVQAYQVLHWILKHNIKISIE
jgi:hypothetical protein